MLLEPFYHLAAAVFVGEDRNGEQQLFVAQI